MIITAGEALVDLVPHAAPGGGPMNTAVACARLGAPTAFLGAVSTDEHGDAIWAHLEASGVDLCLTQRRDEATCRAEVIGDPETDIGPVAVFLASDMARHMTGQTMAVDGGRYLGL